MANPAELLHEILSGWLQDQEPGKQIYIARGTNSSEHLMLQHRRAIVLIEEIDQIVTGMDMSGSRKESIQRNLARWTKWVFAYPHNWLSIPDPTYPNLFDQDALDNLDMVAQLLESQVATIDESRRNSYLENINEVIAALGVDDSLPSELRKHIYTIAAHARHCVEDYEMTGDFALQAAVERLAAAVQTAIKVSSNDGAWSNFKDKFVYPTVAGMIASGPQIAIAVASLPAAAQGHG